MKTSTMRLGIMGGTFDPIHIGHLVCADEALHAFDLDRVVFVPAGLPWQKPATEVSDAEHRLAMVKLATGENPAFSVSRVEMDREGPTYTVDTLKEMSAVGTEMFFITGADAVAQILTWKDPSLVLNLATFIAATRPGHEVNSLPDGVAEHVCTLRIPALEISSTDIRDRVASGRPFRYLVGDAVADYIGQASLYRTRR